MWKLLQLIVKGKPFNGALLLATPASEPASLAVSNPQLELVSGQCCKPQLQPLEDQSGPVSRARPKQLWFRRKSAAACRIDRRMTAPWQEASWGRLQESSPAGVSNGPRVVGSGMGRKVQVFLPLSCQPWPRKTWWRRCGEIRDRGAGDSNPHPTHPMVGAVTSQRGEEEETTVQSSLEESKALLGEGGGDAGKDLNRVEGQTPRAPWAAALSSP